MDPKRLNDLVFVQFNRKMIQRREGKTKTGRSKDVLVGSDESRALHWKSDRVRERENEEEEELFPGSGLTWVTISEASGANESGLRRSKRTLRRENARKQQEGSSSTVLDALNAVEEVNEDPNEEDSDGDEDVVDDYEAPSEVENDDDVHYEDDEEDD